MGEQGARLPGPGERRQAGSAIGKPESRILNCYNHFTSCKARRFVICLWLDYSGSRTNSNSN